jgi:hypothetical protein
VKKILIQLDTDEHPSTFDAIVAHDAGVDELLSYGGIEPDAVRGLVQSAFFTRGPKDLATLAVWVGGSSVGAGEEVLAEVEKAFFGPFRVSAMLDSNGCNTTAATTVARLAREIDLKGRRVVIVGAGAVGLRAAALLIAEGSEVTVSGIPAARFGDKPYRRARGLTVAEERGMDVVEPGDDEELAPRSSWPPVPRASSCCPPRSGARSTRSRCSPTSTRPNRSGSRAPRPRTTSPSATASACSERWRSGVRR